MRRDAIAALALVLVSGPAFSQGPLFGQPAPSFTVGGMPNRVLSADLDGDGNPDLLSVVSGLGLAVRLGDGAGGFGAVTTTADIGTCGLGDFDADGTLDVVYAAALDNANVSYRLGTGTGSFGAPVFLGGPFVVISDFAVGDVDGDGDVDVVASSHVNIFQLIVWRNDAGTLVQAAGSPDNGSFTLRLADLDEDGRLDAVLTHAGPTPEILWDRATGNGAFSFVNKLAIGLGTVPTSIAVGDIDGDGHSDAVVSITTVVGGAAGVLQPFTGNGAGQLVASATSIPMSSVLRSIEVVDVDGDAVVDLVGARTFHNAGVVSALLGTGGGTYGAPIDSVVGDSPLPIAVTDLDGNGHLDILVGNFGATSVSELRSVVADPTGISSFGTGTPGCAGIEGMTASGPATVGSTDFSVIATGAPPSSLGLLLFADAASVAGVDPFGLGVLSHLDFATLSVLFAFDVRSDGHGYATAPIPIVSDPAVAGLTLDAQTWWFWKSCPPSPLGLSTSRGLAIVLQP